MAALARLPGDTETVMTLALGAWWLPHSIAYPTTFAGVSGSGWEGSITDLPYQPGTEGQGESVKSHHFNSDSALTS